MILPNVDLQVVHRLSMSSVIGERPGTESTTYTIDDR